MLTFDIATVDVFKSFWSISVSKKTSVHLWDETSTDYETVL